MIWFTTRKLLEAREQLLQARIRDLEAQLKTATDRERYFRDRYEKLADEVLYARGAITEPVHVDPKPASTPLAIRVMRAAGSVGRDAPAKPADASIADLPTFG